MSKLFNQVSFSKPKKSLIDLSHEKKLTMQMGDLVPIMVHEVVPGDKFRVNTESLIRLAPMVAPVMHRCNAYIHYFFVPNRILFDGWETFITGGEDGKQTSPLPFLRVSNGTELAIRKGTLADYMGLPTVEEGFQVSRAIDINALPFRAYQLIYNEYYRDQNIISKKGITKNGGQITNPEATELVTLRKRAWEKDYFTSALPWSQRGDEVLLPVTSADDTPSNVVAVPGGGVPLDGPLTIDSGKLSGGTTYVNIESPIEITINDLRRSARLQEFLEKTARGGSRLTEVVKSFFGVQSSDSRLQRPEFLGGGKTPVTIGTVMSTFNNTETPGANMYGHGLAVGNTNKFTRFFEEHGWIIGIMSVLPRTSYQNGIPKHFLKFDKFDLYWPTFAQLGEQPVMTGELFFNYDITGPEYHTTWGYQSRYAEYKHALSSVHGDFRESLDFWHMGRKFDTVPQLNETFITADPTQRVFASTDENVHKLYVQLYNDVKAIRPMPYFNNPIL